LRLEIVFKDMLFRFPGTEKRKKEKKNHERGPAGKRWVVRPLRWAGTIPAQAPLLQPSLRLVVRGWGLQTKGAPE